MTPIHELRLAADMGDAEDDLVKNFGSELGHVLIMAAKVDGSLRSALYIMRRSCYNSYWRLTT
jgi:hypothetical protein